MDLVPRQDRLIVKALVKPEDIDLVRPGLEAHVRLLSYKHRRVPPVEGVLTYVSADRLVDKETEVAYYVARVRLNVARAAQQLHQIVARNRLPRAQRARRGVDARAARQVAALQARVNEARVVVVRGDEKDYPGDDEEGD